MVQTRISRANRTKRKLNFDVYSFEKREGVANDTANGALIANGNHDDATSPLPRDPWAARGTNCLLSDDVTDTCYNANSDVRSVPDQTDDFGWVVYWLLALCVAIVALSFIPWFSLFLSDFQIQTSGDHSYFTYKNSRLFCLFGLLSSCCVAGVLGLSCCCFSWVIVYFDSYKPGRIPPTPLSPRKYREESGHTFHMSYAMSMINGLGVFWYYLWSNRGNFLGQ